jgi:hypothetical protein
VIAARNKSDERARREEERRIREPQQKPLAAKTKTITNAYNALYESDDEDDNKPIEKPVVKEEWPTLGEPSKRLEMGGGYAAAAAKQALIVETKAQTLPSGFIVLKKSASYEKTEPAKPTFERTKIRSWADWDTDDEEEEEYVDNSAW